MEALGEELQDFLRGSAPADLAETVAALAAASLPVAAQIRRGPLAGALAAAVGVNTDGDTQKRLDLFADHAFEQGLLEAPVRALASEERDRIAPLAREGKFLVALDPIDGSSNIDVNITIGSVFSVLDAPATSEVAERDFSPARSQPARRGHRALRPAHQPAVHHRRRDACGDAGPREFEILRHPPPSRDPRRAQRICDQHVELASLAGAG